MAHLTGGVLVAQPDEIAQIARSNGVHASLYSDLDSVRTVVEASRALDRPLDAVGNTVLVTIRGEPALVIVPGDRRVRGDRVGAPYGAEALEVSLATKEEAREHTGFDLGMIPPVGHAREVDLLVDEHLLDHETIVLPSGSPNALLEVDPKQLANLPNARVGDWSSPLEDEDA